MQQSGTQSNQTPRAMTFEESRKKPKPLPRIPTTFAENLSHRNAIDSPTRNGQNDTFAMLRSSHNNGSSSYNNNGSNTHNSSSQSFGIMNRQEPFYKDAISVVKQFITRTALGSSELPSQSSRSIEFTTTNGTAGSKSKRSLSSTHRETFDVMNNTSSTQSIFQRNPSKKLSQVQMESAPGYAPEITSQNNTSNSTARSKRKSNILQQQHSVENPATRMSVSWSTKSTPRDHSGATAANEQHRVVLLQQQQSQQLFQSQPQQHSTNQLMHSTHHNHLHSNTKSPNTTTSSPNNRHSLPHQQVQQQQLDQQSQNNLQSQQQQQLNQQDTNQSERSRIGQLSSRNGLLRAETGGKREINAIEQRRLKKIAEQKLADMFFEMEHEKELQFHANKDIIRVAEKVIDNIDRDQADRKRKKLYNQIRSHSHTSKEAAAAQQVPVVCNFIQKSQLVHAIEENAIEEHIKARLKDIQNIENSKYMQKYSMDFQYQQMQKQREQQQSQKGSRSPQKSRINIDGTNKDSILLSPRKKEGKVKKYSMKEQFENPGFDLSTLDPELQRKNAKYASLFADFDANMKQQIDEVARSTSDSTRFKRILSSVRGTNNALRKQPAGAGFEYANKVTSLLTKIFSQQKQSQQQQQQQQQKQQQQQPNKQSREQ